MKLYEKIYELTLFIQTFMFFMFLMENLYNLGEIEYSAVVGDSVTEYTFNFYTMLAIIIAILIVAVLVGISIFGSGFNDSSTVLFRKYLGVGALISILFICSNYYLLQLGTYGIIIDLFFGVGYSFKFINLLTGEDN